MAAPKLTFDFNPRGSVLADVTVESGPWTITGFKVMQPTAKSKSNTIWISWPSVKIGRWKQLVDIGDEDKKKQLVGFILEQYTEAETAKLRSTAF